MSSLRNGNSIDLSKVKCLSNEFSTLSNLHVRDDVVAYIQEFIQAIRGNDSITGVSLERDLVEFLSPEEKMELFEAFGDMKSLKEVSLFHVRALRIEAVTAMLKRASTKIEVLSFNRTAFQGSSNQSFEEFFKVLQQCTALRKFHVSRCPGDKCRLNMSQLLNSLAALPSLRELYMCKDHCSVRTTSSNRQQQNDLYEEQVDALHMIHTSCLVNLTESLRDLTLVNFCVSETQTRAMAASLESGSCRLHNLALMNARLTDGGVKALSRALSSKFCPLRSLSLGKNQLTDVSGVYLAQALGRTCSHIQLQTLDLHDNLLTAATCHELSQALCSDPTTTTTAAASIRNLFLSSNHQLGDEGSIALANGCLSATNCSMEALHLLSTNMSDKGCTAIANALSKNTSLKELNINLNTNIAGNGLENLVDALQHKNFTLRKLQMPMKTPTELQEKVNLFLRLNRLNRGQVFSSLPSTETWLHALDGACQTDDLNSLYYFLRACPSLCCSPVE